MCNTKVLFEAPGFSITQCPNCDHIGLYFGQVLVRFTRTDFKDWAQALGRVVFEEVAICYPDHVYRIILNTCHRDIQFTFTEKEFEQLVEGTQQAWLVLEAVKLACRQ